MAEEPTPPEQAQTPERPWRKGDQGSYTMAVIEVQVCRDKHGRVFSNHQLQDPLDHKTVMAWPGGGMEMISFGLLVEAARREALFGVILKMSKDKEWLSKVNASPEAKAEVVADLTRILCLQTKNTLARIAEGAVEESLLIAESV